MRYAHAVLVVDGKYAMQLRDDHAKVAPGTWGFFGGKMEAGETPLEAVRREIREELELELDQPAHLFDIDRWSFFIADVTAQWPRHILHEGQRAATFSAAEVQTLKSPPLVTQVFNQLLQGRTK